MPSSKIPPEKESLAAFRERRRRERWNAFFTPFLTLTSIVVAVALALSLVKACQERFPNSPFNKAAEPRPSEKSPATER
jgi:hypothetical protein